MNRISRYLLTRIGVSVLTALAILVLLFSFFEFMGELSSVKSEGYTLNRAIVAVGAEVPARIHEQIPIAALLGALFAFARLAQGSEFTVMRASGLAPGSNVRLLLFLGVGLAVFDFAIGEFVLPYSEAYTQRIKGRTGHSITQQFRSGLWTRDGATFINIEHVLPDGSLSKVRMYELDDSYGLRSVREAKRGNWSTSGYWQLEDVTQIDILVTGTRQMAQPRMDWRSQVNPDLLGMLMIPPQQMSITGLYRYILYLDANHQKTERYELALWNKLAYPLAAPIMLLLALPFAYLNTRNRGVGPMLMLGVGLGLVFHFVSRISGNLGALQGWPPALSAWLPLVLFGVLSLLGLWRAERV